MRLLVILILYALFLLILNCGEDFPTGPRGLEIVGVISTPGAAHDVFVKDCYAYVAQYDSGLSIVDIRYPGLPRIVGQYYSHFTAGIYVAGDYVYIADGDSGLQIINIEEPMAPSQVGYYNTSGYANDVFVQDNYAYIAEFLAGIQILNISDPSDPILVGEESTGSCYISVADDYAYTIGFTDDSDFRIVDISSPSAPVIRGRWDNDTDYGAYIRGIFVKGDYAYFLASYMFYGGHGLWIIDISNPSEANGAGRKGLGYSLWDIFISGDDAYIANGENGLVVYDVSNPSAAWELIDYDTPNNDARGVFVSGSYAYVADSVKGLQIIEIVF